jgi:hypothetical protein
MSRETKDRSQMLLADTVYIKSYSYLTNLRKAQRSAFLGSFAKFRNLVVWPHHRTNHNNVFLTDYFNNYNFSKLKQYAP